jgi:hypothetical protein
LLSASPTMLATRNALACCSPGSEDYHFVFGCFYPAFQVSSESYMDI